MVKTKGADAATEKWARKVGQAGPDYEAGVKNPRKDWEAETKKAEGRYKEGVIAAANAGRFGRGVSGKGGKWAHNAATKGVDRWAPGVAAATDDYKAGMSEVISAIEGVTLPPRYPAGDARNLARVAAVNKAVHDKLKGK